MKKESMATYLVIILLLGGVFLFFNFLDLKITGFSVYEQTSQSNFNEGTYNNTEYNGSAVVLSSGQISGDYVSKVFNAGSESTWNNISWTSNTMGELPDNQQGSLMNGNVLLMHLNEASGTIADTSGSGNNGAVTGATYGASGKLNTALSFDGVDDYFEVDDSDSISITGDLTLSAWFNANDLTNYHNIITKESTGTDFSYGITTSSNNIYFWFYADDSYQIHETTSDFLTTEQWWNILAVFDDVNNNVKLYANGIEKYDIDETSSLVDYASSLLRIGWRNSEIAGQQFNGTIDEIAIWNRSLSSDEVLDIYKIGALRLNLTAKSCDDDTCSGESWTDITDTSPQDLDVSNNTYFQYKFDFETDDSSYSPELQDVSIDYTIINSAPTWSSIPNQTWDEDTTLEINLTSYSSDLDGDDLNWSSSYLDNITLTLDNATGMATLIPNSDWFGTEYVIFTATDGLENTDSNNVTLIINNVAEPSAVAESSGGGGGGSRTISINQYPLTFEQILEGYTKELLKNDVIKFSIENKEYGLSLDSFTENSATFTIKSDFVTFVLDVGQDKKLNLNSSDYYMHIILEEVVNSKAKITLQIIHKEILLEDIEEDLGITENVYEELKKEGKGLEITGSVIGFLKSGTGISLMFSALIVVILVYLKKRRKASKKSGK